LQENLFTNWNSTEVGWCNRTTTHNTNVNQQQNGFNRRKYAFWSGPVRVLTSTWVAQSESWPQPEWPSQSPDHNPIEMLWYDLKRANHTRHPNNITELKQFCKEDWSKIPPDHCAGLTRNYRKRLVEVIAAKGGSISY
jgi:hypothetical protein